MKSIILMGIKHCGKSTQARLLGKKLGLPVFDTDTLVEDETGFSPREIYTQKGEQAFKDAETSACLNLKEKLLQKKTDAVIATGGGICNNTDAMEILKSMGVCVFLKADEKIAVERILKEAVIAEDGSIKNLPAYIAKKNPQSLEEVRDIFHLFYEERTKVYASVANVTVAMLDAPKWVNTRQILDAIDL